MNVRESGGAAAQRRVADAASPSGDGPSGPPRTEVLTPDDVAGNAALLSEWQRRAEASTAIYRLYHSPVWWEHLLATRGADALRVIVVRDTDGRISAIVPCERQTHRVARHVAHGQDFRNSVSGSTLS